MSHQDVSYPVPVRKTVRDTGRVSRTEPRRDSASPNHSIQTTAVSCQAVTQLETVGSEVLNTGEGLKIKNRL